MSKAKKEIRPGAVAIYARVGSPEQLDDQARDQLNRCKAYVKENGWQVNAELIYIDRGTSANMARPGLAALKRDVENGLVDCVVMTDLERLTRSMAQAGYLIMQEWRNKCEVRTTTEPGQIVLSALRQLPVW